MDEIIETTSTRITLVATDSTSFPKDRVDKWAEDPFKFVDLAIETRTKFDLILLINPEEFFETKIEKGFTFEELHKELIRNLQFQLLKESGIIILLTHKQNFKLDDYIRPGADKLTKKVLSEEEREKSSLQAYAFYR